MSDKKIHFIAENGRTLCGCFIQRVKRLSTYEEKVTCMSCLLLLKHKSIKEQYVTTTIYQDAVEEAIHERSYDYASGLLNAVKLLDA
jgi:hypothetical protein